MSSTDGPTPSQPQRLPVNPRRHKVPSAQRKRVATACNNCNVRRVKCSGETPCFQCRSSSRDCRYPESLGNVSVSRTELERLRQRCAELERCLEDAVPDQAQRQRMLSATELHGSPAAESSPQTAGGSSVASQAVSVVAAAAAPKSSSETDFEPEQESADRAEGRWLHDPDGTVRYLGETSGATFLDYLKEFMARIIPLAGAREPWMKMPDTDSNGESFMASLGQYQTHDSRPLYEPEVDPLWLPPEAEMRSMLAELRYLAQDGNGTYPSGGTHYWWEGSDSGLSEPLGVKTSAAMPPDPWAKHRHLAFYNAAFAMVCHQKRQSAQARDIPDAHIGEAYFKRAKILIGNPLDTRRYTVGDISTMALMSFYLLENNRRDAACMYVGVAMHIAVMHGAFKEWVDERGKRVFWTLYILDRWLSCLMGRPPTLLDDAIRLELPTDVPSLPPAVGLVANIKLARITSYIVCNTYGIAPWDQQHQHYGNMAGQAAQYHVDKTMQMLESWHASLPATLHLGTEHISPDPAVCNLHMCYNQLIILTARPIFFVAVKKAVAERYIARKQQQRHPPGDRNQPRHQHHQSTNIETHPQSRHIKAGLSAARWNIRIGRWLVSLYAARRKLLHAELHYIFNAAILIILETLMCSTSSSLDEDVQFAISTIEDDSRGGSNYSKDCARVLTDFSVLARRLIASFAWGDGDADPRPMRVVTTAVGLGNGGNGAGPGARPYPGPDMIPTNWAFAQTTLGDGTTTVVSTPPAVSQGLAGYGGGTAAHDGSNLIFQELVNWMETDDLQLYSNFLM